MVQDAEIRPRERDLAARWQGVADHVPVNASQYSLDTAERERAFFAAQLTTDDERRRHREYRAEWFRRAKELDPGPTPLAVTCELVSSCNLGCSMCYTITEEFQGSVVGATRMLPWPVVRAVIDECAELGVPSMLFSWRGESTLYRGRDGEREYRFADVLAYARARGILEVTSLTHGQLLQEEHIQALVAAEPSWISISLDGLAPAYNKIRTPPAKASGTYDAFEIVVANIRRLVEVRDARGQTRPQIRVNSIFPAIANDPEAYRSFMASIGVGWVTVNELLDFRADDLPEADILTDWACQYPFQRLTVAANGTLLPCTGAHNEDAGLVLGRYRGAAPKTVRRADGTTETVAMPELTLAEAWTCEKLEEIRRMHRDLQRAEIDPGCRTCRHGAVKHGVTWVPEDWDMDRMEWAGGTWRE